MQAVSVYFVVDYSRYVIYIMWKAFYCQFILNSKSMYIIFDMSIIIVYINTSLMNIEVTVYEYI